MTVSDAFHDADLSTVSSDPFSWMFRWGKGLRLLGRTMLGSSSLTPLEKTELKRLVRQYVWGSSGRKVLVHGDLHVSHVLVDFAQGALGIIDLEAMHVGIAATNFAQLWHGFHYADAALGRQLYGRYARKYGVEMDDQFDDDIRLEVALRSHIHIRVGRQTGNQELTEKATHLLHLVLSGASFRSLYSE